MAEGYTLAVPVFYARFDRARFFKWSFTICLRTSCTLLVHGATYMTRHCITSCLSIFCLRSLSFAVYLPQQLKRRHTQRKRRTKIASNCPIGFVTIRLSSINKNNTDFVSALSHCISFNDSLVYTFSFLKPFCCDVAYTLTLFASLILSVTLTWKCDVASHVFLIISHAFWNEVQSKKYK